MDRSYPYTRRVIQRARLQRRVGIAVAGAVAACAILYVAMRPAPLDTPMPSAAVAAVPGLKSAMGVTAQPARRVYPYSIVPGGVSGAAELARVIHRDRVVAAHYATFDVARAEKKTVTTPRAVHVSYRRGDKVYWTAKKLMLAEGETLLSDGSHEVRARCANRISDNPQFPIEAQGPSAAELDSSVAEDGPAQASPENVSMGLPEDGGGERPRGFPNAPGTIGSGTAGAAAGNTAGGSLSFTGGQPLFSPVSRGGLLGAGTSGSTGTRPAPGSSSPDGVTDSPAQSTPESSPALAPGSPGMVASPPAPAPPVSTPSWPTRPDATLPLPPAGPVTTPASDLPLAAPGPGLPGVLPAPLPGVAATPRPGDVSGGGDNSVVDTPGAPSDSPIPAPTLSPPVMPAQPVKDATRPTQIPEPGTLWLTGTALAGLLARRRPACRAP